MGIVGRETYADAVVALIRFIGWAEKDCDQLYGAVRASEAFEALSFVTGLPISRLREVLDK